MRLSVFSIVDAFPPDVAAGRDRYAEVVRLAEVAESAGLDGLWVAEHHFHPGGLCPSPPVLLSACGARTRRLRLGAMVSVLPFHRPVDVAEEYALLDQLTGGRVSLGVGSGYIPVEFEGFGVDPATKHAAFESALATIQRAWAGEEVRASPSAARSVTLNVRPVQRPHPPLWVAVQRREAIPFVARRGASLALIPYATVAGLPELAEEIREFRASLPPGVRADVAVGVHLYAGPDVAGARAAYDRFLASRLRTQSTFYQTKAARDPHHASREGLEAAGLALFGTPEDVAQRLDAFRRIGVDEVLGMADFGGLPLEDVAASVTALGRSVRR